MARSLRILYPGAFYHVFARGNARQQIVRDDRDRAGFLKLLEEAVTQFQLVIHAYCVMSNHYHLLLETPEPNLSQAMRHINGVYTQAFNRRHQTVGHLFQGRFKAYLVEKERYGLALHRYIHLNPVQAKIVKRPEDYRWSSYPAYMGIVQAPRWLELDWVMSQFGSHRSRARRALREYTEEGMAQPEEPFRQVHGQTILGSEAFLSRIQREFVAGRRDREIPALRRLEPRPSANRLLTILSEAFGVDKGHLVRRKPFRQVCTYLLRRHSHLRLKELATLFPGMGYTGVSQAVRRIERRRDEAPIKQLIRQGEGAILSNVKT